MIQQIPLPVAGNVFRNIVDFPDRLGPVKPITEKSSKYSNNRRSRSRV